jgi:hypothetical protein
LEEGQGRYAFDNSGLGKVDAIFDLHGPTIQEFLTRCQPRQCGLARDWPGDPSSYLEDCETPAYIACMSVRGLLAVALLFAVSIPCAFGQLPKRVEKCLPYPTLAQEIREMRPVPPQARIRVIRVEFVSNDDVPADAREEISTELRSHVFERDADTAYLNDLANEIAEVGARGALQNRGYVSATTAAKLTALQSEGTDISVAVVISADPGVQYRTGDIRVYG